MASIGEAEANLRSAFDKSDQEEPLPYIWLSALYERLGKWIEARETATTAISLDPRSSAILLRVFNTYEQEKDYINALKYYGRALSILPVFERSMHDTKLARLKEQAEDARAHVIRLHPVEKLPHELMLSVMQYGLASQDRDFVLRCTWVSRQWRETLINSPTLWGTFTFDAEELKNKKTEDKRQAFIERSGKKIHTVEFNKLLLSSVDKIHKKLLFIAKAQNQNQYPALRSLTANKRAFMSGYRPIQSSDRWQSDPLHRALRTTTVLETLAVIPEEKTTLLAAQPGIGMKCTLNALRTLTLPPPTVWALDIITPNVEVLKFVLPSEIPHVNDTFLSPHVRPLLPDVHHSLVPQDMLWKFTHVEFQCFDMDDIERLESWIPHLSNVKILAVRGFRRPYPQAASGEHPDNRVQVKVLESLIHHSEWLNKLEELHLDGCYTPDSP